MRFLVAIAILASTAGCASLRGARARDVVVIDPGHPSETAAGNVVQNGTTEVHIAWVVSLALRDELRERGFDVLLTKQSESELVTNRERAEVGNRSGAMVMVRLHCDASSDSGFAVYHPDRQGTVDGVTGPSADVIARSAAAARIIHASMAEQLRGHLKDGGVRGDSRTLVGSRQGALTGSIYSRVPAVLVEMVTLSNARDAAFIKVDDGQRRMARAIADGITNLRTAVHP